MGLPSCAFLEVTVATCLASAASSSLMHTASASHRGGARRRLAKLQQLRQLREAVQAAGAQGFGAGLRNSLAEEVSSADPEAEAVGHRVCSRMSHGQPPKRSDSLCRCRSWKQLV